MRMMNSAKPLMIAVVLAASGMSAVAETVLNQEQKNAAQLAIKSMLLNLKQDPAFENFGDDDWDFAAIFSGETISDFGIVLDPNFNKENTRTGLLVLAVTPRSAAALMGIRSGDRIRSIDQLNLLKDRSVKANKEGTIIRPHNLPDGKSKSFMDFLNYLKQLPDVASISLSIDRQNEIIELSGEVRKMRLPRTGLQIRGFADESTKLDENSPDACATVNFRVRPPKKHHMYKTRLLKINDRRGGATTTDIHFLTPGVYNFTMEPAELPRDIASLITRKSKFKSLASKTISIEIEDQYVYYIGAKFANLRRSNSLDTHIWSPVVWRFEPRECKGKAVSR